MEFKHIFIMTILLCVSVWIANTPYSRHRVSQYRRKFSSDTIEEVIFELTSKMKDSILADMFEQNFPNTLDTTVLHYSTNETSHRPDTFVITGDIKAMWLRDSTNQIMPYLKFMDIDPRIKDMVLGVINRQTHSILVDAYANAYNYEPTGSFWQSDNTTKLNEYGERVKGMQMELWERKYEIDSIAAVLKLATEYFSATNGTTDFMHEDYFKSLRRIRDLIREQQIEEIDPDFLPYTFVREDTSNPFAAEHRAFDDVVKTIKRSKLKSFGMVKSYFRPSDDFCEMPFFIPGNAMLSIYLNRTASMIAEKDAELSEEFAKISQEIKDDIYARGMTRDSQGREVFAYETDGLGNFLKMDDANLPSLLGLPSMGFIERDDPIYVNTRRMLLSSENPYFFQGTLGEGIGSPHTPKGSIWPMSLITQAMTSEDDNEILRCLHMLKTTTADTYFMHESFDANNDATYTRPWFAWANSYFGELILHIAENKPHIVLNSLQPAQYE